MLRQHGEGDEAYSRRLAVEAPTKGVDYRATFEVPVFVDEGSDPTKVRSAVAEVEEIVEQPRRSRIRLTRSGTSAVLTLPVPGWMPGCLICAMLPLRLAWPASRMGDLKDVPFGLVIAGAVLLTLFLQAINLTGVLYTPRLIFIDSECLRVGRGLGPVG